MQTPVMQHRAGAAPCARPLPAHTILTCRIHSRAAGAPAAAAQPRSLFGQPSTSRPSSSAAVACRAAQRTFQNAAEEPALIPQSREEAVEQACAAIAAQLSSSKKVKSKGFSGSGSTKFSVEVPVADSSAAGTLALARDIIQGLPAHLRAQTTLVAADEAACAATGVPSLRQCLAEGRQLGGCLLVAGASKAQVGEVSRLLAAWRGPGAVLLNADWWADDSLPEEHQAFVGTFEAIYSFVPLEVKAFVTTQQGAVFKWVRSGAPASTPWRLFSLDGKSWAQVGRMQRRPSAADIETAFYNASAAKSPLTQGAKFLRGLVPGGKKQ